MGVQASDLFSTTEEQTTCYETCWSNGDSVNDLPPTKYVWCWERPESKSDTPKTRNDAPGARSTNNPEPAISDPDVGLTGEHSSDGQCHCMELETILQAEGCCWRCMCQVAFKLYESPPIRDILESQCVFEKWIESCQDGENREINIRKKILFRTTLLAESLLSTGASRAEVKVLCRFLMKAPEDDISDISDIGLIALEVVRERLDDILDSAGELHRIYETETIPGQDEWLYHYSSSVADIWSSGEIRPSLEEGHIKFGRGVYFTELSPRDASATEIRDNNYDGSSEGLEKVCACIKIPKRSVEERIERRIDPKRPERNIWIIPTEDSIPLPSGSRLEFYDDARIAQLDTVSEIPVSASQKELSWLTKVLKDSGSITAIQVFLFNAKALWYRVNCFIVVYSIFIAMGSSLLSLGQYPDNVVTNTCFYAQVSYESFAKYTDKSINPESMQSNTWIMRKSGAFPLPSNYRVVFRQLFVHHIHDIISTGWEHPWLVTFNPNDASVFPKNPTEGKCTLETQLKTNEPPVLEGHCLYSRVPKELVEKYAKESINPRLIPSTAWIMGENGTVPLLPHQQIKFYDYGDLHIHYSDDTLHSGRKLHWLVTFNPDNVSVFSEPHKEGICTLQKQPSNVIGHNTIILLSVVLFLAYITVDYYLKYCLTVIVGLAIQIPKRLVGGLFVKYTDPKSPHGYILIPRYP